VKEKVVHENQKIIHKVFIVFTYKT